MKSEHAKEVGRLLAELAMKDIDLTEAAVLVGVQLDRLQFEAYKVGMTDAAKEIDFVIGEKETKLCIKQQILSARDNKTEI